MYNELIDALRYCISDEYVEKGCLICPICAPRQGEMKCNSQDDAIKYAADALEAADKRIAELEAQLPKEGEWIESEDWESAVKGKVVCSICGEPQFTLELTNEFVRMKNQKTNYCPNCGAKMDGAGGERRTNDNTAENE